MKADVGEVLLLTESWDVTAHLFADQTQKTVTHTLNQQQCFTKFSLSLYVFIIISFFSLWSWTSRVNLTERYVISCWLLTGSFSLRHQQSGKALHLLVCHWSYITIPFLPNKLFAIILSCSWVFCCFLVIWVVLLLNIFSLFLSLFPCSVTSCFILLLICLLCFVLSFTSLVSLPQLGSAVLPGVSCLH